MSSISPPAKSYQRQPLSSQDDYQSLQSLPEIWALVAQKFQDVVALKAPHSQPMVEITYGQLHQQIRQFAAGLQSLGVEGGPGLEPPRVALIADNSPRWLVADQGSMMAGAADAVRSPQADREELLFILEDSASTTLIAEDQETLEKLQPQLSKLPLKLIVLLCDHNPDQASSPQIVNYTQVMAAGQKAIDAGTFIPIALAQERLATLIYTSGTSGRPKGVMLSHSNLLHQVRTLDAVIQPKPGDRVLSILPIWHVYERAAEYFLLSCGCTQIYTNLRQVKRDLQHYKPHYMVSVPRLWESIYEGVQKQFREQPPSRQRLINFFFENSQRYIDARRLVQKLSLKRLNPSTTERLAAGLQMMLLAPLHNLGNKIVYQKVREATGGSFKQSISGGGSLGMYLENFFEIVGIQVLVGYGLTETSPVLTARRPWRNLRGSAGQPIPQTEIRIVDPESHRPLPQGERGVIVARGPQVMQGYDHNPHGTAQVIDSEGWFNTGDLGWLTPQNDLVITGRAKDTIVLSNGENIEPQPLEDACLRSPYIDQIVVVGQDQRSLGALIVPNLEALQQWAVSQSLFLALPEAPEKPAADYQPIQLDSKPIQELFRQELNREVKNRPGYRPDDRIGPFRFVVEGFSIENGTMTQKFSIRRPLVMERYQDMINGMFD